MQIAVFSSKRYDQDYLGRSNEKLGYSLRFLETRLTVDTAPLAQGSEVVCAFVNDDLSEEVIVRLAESGVKLIALRSAGFNNVNLPAAQRLGIAVVRVSAYSPHSVAEHTVGLMLCLNRNIHRAYQRVRDGNFELTGLLGFDFQGRTVGIVGTGKIGRVVAEILRGFGCRILGFDPHHDPSFVGDYCGLDDLVSQSDIITLHTPLREENHHLIDSSRIAAMRQGVMLVNTSRGPLLDTEAVIEGLKSGKIGHLALDVYEGESGLFFEDRSGQVIQDDVFARLLTFPNVLITGHQAFFTHEALSAIADTTMHSIDEFAHGRPLTHRVE